MKNLFVLCIAAFSLSNSFAQGELLPQDEYKKVSPIWVGKLNKLYESGGTAITGEVGTEFEIKVSDSHVYFDRAVVLIDHTHECVAGVLNDLTSGVVFYYARGQWIIDLRSNGDPKKLLKEALRAIK